MNFLVVKICAFFLRKQSATSGEICKTTCFNSATEFAALTHISTATRWNDGIRQKRDMNRWLFFSVNQGSTSSETDACFARTRAQQSSVSEETQNLNKNHSHWNVCRFPVSITGCQEEWNSGASRATERKYHFFIIIFFFPSLASFVCLFRRGMELHVKQTPTK